MTEAVATYTAVPFTPTLERAAIVSHLVRSIARYETLFTDYSRACDERCFETRELPEMCAACQARIANVNRLLTDPYSRSWEVWSDDADMPVGLLYLTNVIPGGDALAHYVFFDGDLRSKTALIDGMIAWTFDDHPQDGWRALHRLTIEVPAYAFALARHAVKFLGFGGPYVYAHKSAHLSVEGVRRNAVQWRGSPHDILILGRLA